jgi:hypothetical protein
MCRPAAWHRKKTDLRLVSITASQSSSLKSTASARRTIPALFTRMSIPPSSARVCSTTPWTGATVERSAVTSAAAGGSHQSGRFFGAGAADEGDVGPRLRKRDGNALADAGIGAGDDGDPAGEIEHCAHNISIRTVRPQLVEGLPFSPSARDEGGGFDRLSPNGF